MKRLSIVGLVLLLGAGSAFAGVSKTADSPAVTVWEITEPTVTQRETDYGDIAFTQGDTVVISAGGCVQTGGHGNTWKRYVNPSGSNSDHLYHGLIRLPGQGGLMRIGDFMNNLKQYVVPASGDMTLHLGYEDDDYGDNGYWGHDDGTEDQCKNVGNAWVTITVVHAH
jgi:hypothetical protein